jgi:dolichol kinase
MSECLEGFPEKLAVENKKDKANLGEPVIVGLISFLIIWDLQDAGFTGIALSIAALLLTGLFCEVLRIVQAQEQCCSILKDSSNSEVHRHLGKGPREGALHACVALPLLLATMYRLEQKYKPPLAIQMAIDSPATTEVALLPGRGLEYFCASVVCSASFAVVYATERWPFAWRLRPTEPYAPLLSQKHELLIGSAVVALAAACGLLYFETISDSLAKVMLESFTPQLLLLPSWVVVAGCCVMVQWRWLRSDGGGLLSLPVSRLLSSGEKALLAQGVAIVTVAAARAVFMGARIVGAKGMTQGINDDDDNDENEDDQNEGGGDDDDVYCVVVVGFAGACWLAAAMLEADHHHHHHEQQEQQERKQEHLLLKRQQGGGGGGTGDRAPSTMKHSYSSYIGVVAVQVYKAGAVWAALTLAGIWIAVGTDPLTWLVNHLIATPSSLSSSLSSSSPPSPSNDGDLTWKDRDHHEIDHRHQIPPRILILGMWGAVLIGFLVLVGQLDESADNEHAALTPSLPPPPSLPSSPTSPTSSSPTPLSLGHSRKGGGQGVDKGRHKGWKGRRRLLAKRTVVRKLFHALACALFVPAAIVDPVFLSLAYAVAAALLVVIEACRAADGGREQRGLWPFGNSLRAYYARFVDSRETTTTTTTTTTSAASAKDATPTLVLTPIYLLLGCALPHWIVHSFSPSLRGIPAATAAAGDAAGVASPQSPAIDDMATNTFAAETAAASTAAAAQPMMSAAEIEAGLRLVRLAGVLVLGVGDAVAAVVGSALAINAALPPPVVSVDISTNDVAAAKNLPMTAAAAGAAATTAAAAAVSGRGDFPTLSSSSPTPTPTREGGGVHLWPRQGKARRSLEGSAAGVLAMGVVAAAAATPLFVPAASSAPLFVLKLPFALFLLGVLEAYTTQIDNLVLPLFGTTLFLRAIF